MVVDNWLLTLHTFSFMLIEYMADCPKCNTPGASNLALVQPPVCVLLSERSYNCPAGDHIRQVALCHKNLALVWRGCES